jgi:hypothetical protein
MARQIPRPRFAFTDLAAGLIAEGGVGQVLWAAFTSVRSIDGVWVGLFRGARTT